jgi:hypothetical protein
MAREIPNTATEIQPGLYHNLVVGRYITYSELYSSEGYCFYDVTAEVWDEEGNVIPPEDIQPNQRLYAQYCSTPITDVATLNAIYVSVLIQPYFEVVGTNKPSTEIR